MLETEPQIVEAYIATGKARLIYRHLAQLGATSGYLAAASECAGEQGSFWQMRHLIYAQQGKLGSASTPADLAALAQTLDLDRPRFNQCLDEGRFAAQVDADYAAAQREGISSRPVLDVDGTRLIGALSFERYRQALDAAQP